MVSFPENYVSPEVINKLTLLGQQKSVVIGLGIVKLYSCRKSVTIQVNRSFHKISENCNIDMGPRFKWCRNKRFKDIPRSTCLTSSERRTLHLNGCGPRFNAHWSCILFFFGGGASCSKISDANTAIVPNFVCLGKFRIVKSPRTYRCRHISP